MIFLIFSSGGPFRSIVRNHLCNFSRGYHEEHFCEIILNLDQWVSRCQKTFSYLELWRPLCSAEQNHLCNFGPDYVPDYVHV